MPLDLTVSDGCILLSAVIVLSQVHLEKRYRACPQVQARGLGLTVPPCAQPSLHSRQAPPRSDPDLQSLLSFDKLAVESLSWKVRHSTAVVFKS